MGRWRHALLAAVLSGVGAGLLLRGGARAPVAIFAGAGAACFSGWRTFRGAVAGAGALLAAALAAWVGAQAPSLAAILPLLPWLGALESFGVASLILAARAQDPPRLGRRLLGAWLASSGLTALGLALAATERTEALGSALVAGALAYRLGVVPAFAFAPLLLRHPDRRIAALGAAAFALASGVLLHTLPRLPDPGAAARALVALCVGTAPWALWHAVRQWRSDPRCAGTYAAVTAAAGSLLIILLRR